MLIDVSHLNKNYGIHPVLTNVAFQIQPKDRIGLIGVNGAGKTTLLQVLSGESKADSGEIFIPKEVKIGYFKQNHIWQSDATIWSEMRSIFSHVLDLEQELRKLETQISELTSNHPSHAVDSLMDRYAQISESFKNQNGFSIEAKIRSVLNGLGFPSTSWNLYISTLSGGQKARLALAKILLEEPQLLLLDEPTNHLDIPTLIWLEGYLHNYPGAIMLISHDRYFLDKLVHTIFEMERHTLTRYTGNYSAFIETKARNMQILLKHYEKQQEQIEKMEDFIQRNIARASTTKRAQSRKKALHRMDKLDKPLEALSRVRFSFEIEQHSARDVLELHELSLGYFSEKPLLNGISLRIHRGESIAFIGENGVGKTTLFKSLIGSLPPVKGSMKWGVHVKIAYFDQEQAFLHPHHTILDEVWSSFPHIEEPHIRKVLAGFLFRGDDINKKISSLSGGERARVALAKLMLQKANVLVLDEPTNHLDIYSKEMLEAALLDFEGTLLFISHDRYFLNKLAEKIIEMKPHGLTTYSGNYDDYIAKKEEQAELQKIRESEGSTTNSVIPWLVSSHLEQKKMKRDDRAKKRKLDQLEIEISSLESQITEAEFQLTDPSIYQDYMRVESISSHLENLKNQLKHLYDEWALLADKS